MRALPMKKMFTLRTTPGFLADLHSAADVAGLTASDFIRETVGERIQRGARKRRADFSSPDQRGAS